jgi:hypothetical protein
MTHIHDRHDAASTILPKIRCCMYERLLVLELVTSELVKDCRGVSMLSGVSCVSFQKLINVAWPGVGALNGRKP